MKTALSGSLRLCGSILFVVAIVGCDDADFDLFAELDGPVDIHLPQASGPHRPLAALPAGSRQMNYGPSCNHAAAINLFNRCGMHDWAAWYRRTHYGPHFPDDTFHELDKLGLTVSQTRFKGDFAFLEECAASGRWAALSDIPGHARNFAGMTATHVCIVDVNFPNKPLWFPKEQWRRDWTNNNASGSRNGGGYAWTLAYSPIPAPLY